MSKTYLWMNPTIEQLQARVKELEYMVVTEFSGDEVPQFHQGIKHNELTEVVSAERCTSLVEKIVELRAQNAELQGYAKKLAATLCGLLVSDEYEALLPGVSKEVDEARAVLALPKPWEAK
jgi:hypothetical protein